MKKEKLKIVFLMIVLIVVVGFCLQSNSYFIVFEKIKSLVVGKKTVADRVQEFEGKVSYVLNDYFSTAGVLYPPKKVTLVFLKEDRRLRVYAGDEKLKYINEYPVLAASGISGPKLLEGDQQVPEGLYKIEALNPNSTFHLSLRINYPNEFDKKMANLDGRVKLGSDIMIHGYDVSIGCIAIGNAAIEELFILAAKSNWQNWDILIAPHDLRKKPRERKPNLPTWIGSLDENILAELNSLPAE